jgi:hypothetical protein
MITNVPHVAHMLGQLKGEKATDVLPALRTIEFDCPDRGASSKILRLLEPFLVARKKSGHPVVVNDDSDF